MTRIRDKPIRLSGHARGYLDRRGFTEKEVIEAIRTQPRTLARGHRLETSMEFPYNGEWNGRFYATKRVRPIFVDTPDEIVVVTVYTYYF